MRNIDDNTITNLVRKRMYTVHTKGIGSNTYVKVEDIVKAIRAELNLNCDDDNIFEAVISNYRIQVLVNNLEGIQFNNRCGNVEIDRASK